MGYWGERGEGRDKAGWVMMFFEGDPGSESEAGFPTREVVGKNPRGGHPYPTTVDEYGTARAVDLEHTHTYIHIDKICINAYLVSCIYIYICAYVNIHIYMYTCRYIVYSICTHECMSSLSIHELAPFTRYCNGVYTLQCAYRVFYASICVSVIFLSTLMPVCDVVNSNISFQLLRVFQNLLNSLYV